MNTTHAAHEINVFENLIENGFHSCQAMTKINRDFVLRRPISSCVY